MNLALVQAPAAEPLSAAEVKAFLGIGSEVTDATIDFFIKAARQTIDGWDGWLGRALINQTWRLTLDRFSCEPIMIPLPPLRSISSVKYIDVSGNQITIPAERYRILQGTPARLTTAPGASWPSVRSGADAVEIEFVAGYGTAGADVDAPIRSAITLMVSNLRSLSARNLFVSSETTDGVGSTSYVVGGNAGAAIDSAVKYLLASYRVYY